MISEYTLHASMDCKNLQVIKFFNLLTLVLYLLSGPRLVFTDYKVNFPWTICIALALPSINAQLVYYIFNHFQRMLPYSTRCYNNYQHTPIDTCNAHKELDSLQELHDYCYTNSTSHMNMLYASFVP